MSAPSAAARLLVATVLPLVLAACAPEQGQAETNGSAQEASQMEISRGDTRRPAPGSAQNFTGSVTITPLFGPKGQSQVSAALVRFEPGARSAWHSHPLGQRLVVTAGAGWTQVEGGPVEEIREGDVVWCPPNKHHWHGATPTTAMSHIAIQEAQDGSPVTWMEHVTDEEYRQASRQADD
jgi:quercetin dioxygenase-like cupin family protein